MVRRIVLFSASVLVVVALLSQQGHFLRALATDRQASPAGGSEIYAGVSEVGVETTLDLFVDVSQVAGIVQNGIFSNRVVGAEKAIGQAWGDYDNDGWVDLYVTDPRGANTLYRNNQDGTFSVSALSSQVALATAYSNGANFADFDNDGWRDLYVVNRGANVLFRNVSGTKFVDVTAQAGVGDTADGKTASWGDYNNDGYLDLYVANWSCYPSCGRSFDGDADVLYHNNGDGTFTNVTRLLSSGINGAGFVASFTDYDNDGDQDIYLVNDEFINPVGNILWRNDGPGCEGWCFSEVSREAGANSTVFGMGLATSDYDNDGDLDFFYTNVGPMELLQNQGDGTFRDVAAAAGVQSPLKVGWGTVFFDYNNDGWQDLYVAIMEQTNGHDIAANALYHNNANGTFTLAPCRVGASEVGASMGVAYADYDRDGWVDLIVGNADESYKLYRNQSSLVLPPSEGGNWLSLKLTGAGRVNRDAVGARVYVTTRSGTTQMQEVTNGSSLGAGNDLTLHFGLGGQAYAQVRVRWPDGTEQNFASITGGHHYQLTYPLESATFPEVIFSPTQPSPAAGMFPSVERDVLTLVGGLLVILGFGLLTMRTAGAVMLISQERIVSAGLVGAGALAVILSSLLYMNFPVADAPAGQEDELARLMAQAGVEPLHMPSFSPDLVSLGEALFWDPELSGNRDTACATCHHSLFATGDGLSVSIGTTGRGLGDQRIRPEDRKFVPRNAPPIFNLGYTEWNVFFWDGRVSGNAELGFNTPATDRLPDGLSTLLAAQAMFPVTSREEMRGEIGDTDIFGQRNELATILDWDMPGMWQALMKRLLAIPAYQELFARAYPDLKLDDLGFEHAANALAAYQAVSFTFEDSPFDRYLAGDQTALSAEQYLGGLLFYGKAGCADCHSGGLLTDQRFHNIAVPLVGHGKGRERPLDLGRARETGSDCDRFAFRTPPLRNVTLTGPWMHNGAFTSLEAAVRHHLDAENSLLNFDPSQLSPAMASTCIESPDILAAVLATLEKEKTQVQLSDAEIQAILAFLDALTSPTALDLKHTIPASVPSGLTVGGN